LKTIGHQNNRTLEKNIIIYNIPFQITKTLNFNLKKNSNSDNSDLCRIYKVEKGKL